MFSTEFNGYNKQEVDNQIASLKAQHEKALMEERLKVLEAEKNMLALKNKYVEMERREQKLIAIIKGVKKLQIEGNRNIDVLRGEQLRVIYSRMQSFLQDLIDRYPSIALNTSYKKLIADIESVIDKTNAKVLGN